MIRYWSNRVANAFRRNLFIGIIALAPIALTVWIVLFLFRLLVANQITRFMARQLLRLWPYETGSQVQEVIARIVAFLLIVAGVTLLGFAVRGLFGRRLYRLGERLLERIPVINRIYLFIRQVAEAIFTQRKTLFREVVFVEYPRPGVFSIAFVTAHVPDEFLAHTPFSGEGRLLALFVPTTPNPTSGFLIFAYESQVRRCPASTADAMSLILSGGTIYPVGAPDLPRPRLLDLLQERADDAAPPGPPPAPPPSPGAPP